VHEIFLVVGFAHEQLEEYFCERGDPDITFVHNDQWERGNGISVLAVADHLSGDGPFLLAMSDHLVRTRALKELMGMVHEIPVLLVDRTIAGVFDIEDATKVMVEGKRVIQIGKELEMYNGVDAGVFLLDRRVFPFLKKAIEKGEDSLTAGIRAMLGEHALTPCTIPEGEYWIDIDSEDAYRNALKMWRGS
jgi:choline kinase